MGKILYHASRTGIQGYISPDYSVKGSDFGKGFYLYEDYITAVSRLQGYGGFIYVYMFNRAEKTDLLELTPSQWYSIVRDNRMGAKSDSSIGSADVICGPCVDAIGNLALYPNLALDKYKWISEGIFDFSEDIWSNYQFCFKSVHACCCLDKIKVKQISVKDADKAMRTVLKRRWDIISEYQETGKKYLHHTIENRWKDVLVGALCLTVANNTCSSWLVQAIKESKDAQKLLNCRNEIDWSDKYMLYNRLDKILCFESHKYGTDKDLLLEYAEQLEGLWE